MTMPVLDGHEDEPQKPHPENDKMSKITGRRRHDWLDDQFDDEIDLERSMADAPPHRLVQAATIRGAVPNAAKDAPWHYLGKYKPTKKRPAADDSHWSLTCRRCKKRGVKTTRIVLPAVGAHKADWLSSLPSKRAWLMDKMHAATIDETPEHSYRVGRCGGCSGVFWFEMKVKK